MANYTPDYADIGASATATFDGSASSTGDADISSLAGNGDAEIRIEASNDGGSTWTTITLLENASGGTTFSGSWHTQFNKLPVSTNTRRVKITNTSGGQAQYSVAGNEV